MGRWGWVVAAAMLAACPPFPDSGAYRCESDGDCSSGQVCSRSVCTSCVPKTCAELPGACDSVDDGCGRALFCECTAPETCGGGGEPGRCGCAPRTCDDFAPGCGAFEDGCGASVFCGCGPHSACSAEGLCRCSPDSCESLQASCGWIDDGCGAASECGTCEWPASCGGGEVERSCGRNSACEALGAECGFAVVSTATSSTRGVYCGRCPEGQACERLQCAPALRPICWGPLRRFDDSRYRAAWPSLFPFEERGVMYFYAATAAFETIDPGCSRHVRMRIDGPLAPDVDSTEVLDSSVFEFREPLEALCVKYRDVECDGWVSRPAVRADGLEMFFHGNYPCGDWRDTELFLAFRYSTWDAWSKPVLLERLTTLVASQMDSAHFPLLLPDGRTLVYAADGEPGLRVARRRSAQPGTTDFESTSIQIVDEAELAPGEQTRGMTAQSISCDGGHLIYSRTVGLAGGGDRHEIRIARILSTEPVMLGVSLAHSPWMSPERLESVVEAPDCSTLYVRDEYTQFYRRRVDCP